MARTRTPLPLPQLLTGLITVLASVAIAVASAWPIYGSGQAILAAGVATGIGTGSIVLGWLLAWRWWQTGALAFGLYLITVVPVAIPSATASPERILAGVGTGVLDIVMGWKRLLTIEVPTGDFQSVLVPYFFTLTMCTLLATALIVHGRRWAPFAVAPLLLMWFFGAYLGTSNTGADFVLGPITVPAPMHTVLAVAAFTVCATWLIVRARVARSSALRDARARTDSARLGSSSSAVALRRHLLALVMVVVTVGGVLAVAPFATAFGAREVVRDQVDPLLMLQRQASPLSSYREWFGAALYNETLFSVSNAERADRLRIATLDAYDGNSFHVRGTDEAIQFSRQPQVQEPDIEITIGPAFRGVWVPLTTADAGAPVFGGDRAAQLADSYYASSSLGAGVIVEGQGSDSVEGLQTGDTYAVQAVTAPYLDEFLTVSGNDSRLNEDTHPSLVAWVESQELPRTGAGLVELVQRLRDRGYISHSLQNEPNSTAWLTALSERTSYQFQGSRSGHSIARVERIFESLLDQQGRAGEGAATELLVSAVGDDEQFAPAAALLARHLGFDSRVVVGVRLGQSHEDFAVEACMDECTGANVTAWAEVRAPGGEWFALDTTPQFTVPPTLIEVGQTLPENPTEPHQVPAEVIDPPTILSDTTDEPTPANSNEDPQWTDDVLPVVFNVIVVLGAVLLLLAPFVVFPLTKWILRRWRRGTRVPEVAMVAAWDELIDRYVDAGIDVPVGLTRAETADVLERPGAVAIAARVDQAVFAEHPPSREVSQELWELLDSERREMRSETSFSRRVRAIFTPSAFTHTLRTHRSAKESTLRRKDRTDG